MKLSCRLLLRNIIFCNAVTREKKTTVKLKWNHTYTSVSVFITHSFKSKSVINQVDVKSFFRCISDIDNYLCNNFESV